MLEKIRTIREFFTFLWERRLWWLIPMLLVFLLVAVLILFIGSSPLAPIVYPLF